MLILEPTLCVLKHIDCIDSVTESIQSMTKVISQCSYVLLLIVDGAVNIHVALVSWAG